MNKWTKKFPKKEGNYWFYGYRYGKVSCGYKSQPEYMFVKVINVLMVFYMKPMDNLWVKKKWKKPILCQ